MFTIEQRAGNVSTKANKHHPDTEDPVPCTEYTEYSVHCAVQHRDSTVYTFNRIKKETNTQLSKTHPCRVIQTCTPITSIELNDLTWDRFIFWKLFEFIQFLFQVSWLVIEPIRFHNVDDWVEILSDWYDWFNSIDLKNAKNGQRHITFSQIEQRNRSFFSEKSQEYIELFDRFDWIIWDILVSWSNRLICRYLVAWLNWLKYSSYTDS